MFGKAFGIILTVCLVQSINASFVDSVNELQEAIQYTNGSITDVLRALQEAALHIANVTINGDKQIENAYISIRDSINHYERNLTQQRADLVRTIMEAQANASSSGKNISACLNEAQNSSLALIALDLGFEKCRISKELSNLTIALIHVGELGEDVLGAIPRCLSKSGGKDDERFRNCTLGSFAVDKEQADHIQSQIGPVTSAAVQNAIECGGQQSNTISKFVEQIKTNFTDCVSKA